MPSIWSREQVRAVLCFVELTEQGAHMTEIHRARQRPEDSAHILEIAREISVDVRVVAATHRDLEGLCAAGQFRSDLYYRLSVMVIPLPPLRDRTEDIEPLTRRFLARCGDRVRHLTPDALACLRAYAWPGNSRSAAGTTPRMPERRARATA